MRRDDSDRLEKWAATSLMTAFALLLTLILCGPAAVAQSAAFHGNGAFADEFSCAESQTSIECISVGVLTFTGSANGQKTTFLDYDHFIMDLNTGALLQDAFGFGQIPNSAVQIHGQTDSLNVDTSTVAGFFNRFCTFDPNTGIPTCNLTSGGVVTGTWTVISNLFTLQESGTFRETFPNMIFISTGTSKSQAARATVNVLGAALANVRGNVGTNHNTSVTVQVRH
jgi:hypothetical protein